MTLNEGQGQNTELYDVMHFFRNEAVTASNLIAIAAPVFEIWLATDRETTWPRLC